MIYIQNPTKTENVLLLEIEILTYQLEKTELIGKIILQKRSKQDFFKMKLRLEWVEGKIKI